MKITVEDLREGDEFLSPSNGTIKYMRVLGTPKPHSTRIIPSTGKPWMKAVRCAIAADIAIVLNRYSGKNRQKTEYHFRDYNLNHKISINLNCKDLWLVKRTLI